VRRLFWLALGASGGVLVVRKLTRTAQAFTPAGVSQGLSGLGDALRAFGEDVRAGMAEREAELNDALGITEEHQLEPEVAAQLATHPTQEWRPGR
jgi:Family of unknown function (DUF6167)